MKPSTEEFRRALDELLKAGEELGHETVEINAGHLHRQVGGFPDNNHRMPVCCWVMRQAVASGDVVVRESPGGRGASLTIRYRLSRRR